MKVVAGRDGVAVMPNKQCYFCVAGGMWPGKSASKLCLCVAAGAACLPAYASRQESEHHLNGDNNK